MKSTNQSTSLQDVLYAIALAKPVPDAALLDDFIRRYPQYSAEVTDFAIELAIDTLTDENEPVALGSEPTMSRAVSGAISQFQNRLFALNAEEARAKARPPAPSAPVQNPFLSLDRNEFRDVTRRLNANLLFMQKLRDGQINPDTMTDGFKQRLAAELEVPIEVVIAHSASPPQIPPNQLYKAERKPEVVGQQTFETAVRTSGLTEEQQQFLLSL